MRAIKALRSVRVNFHSNGRAMLSKWRSKFASLWATASKPGKSFGDAQARLDAGLLVGRDDAHVVAQCLSLPAPLVQVQDPPGLGLQVRISRKDPATVVDVRPTLFASLPCGRRNRTPLQMPKAGFTKYQLLDQHRCVSIETGFKTPLKKATETT
jgi:hypothetical protein